MYFGKKLAAALAVALASTLTAMAAGPGFGKAENFNDGWRFTLEADSTALLPDFDDSEWRQLSLPHDWSIEGIPSATLASCTGYLPGGIGWYRKTFEADADSAMHRFIYFEGVYNRSEVYLNGHLLGYRPNGYVSFLYDLTPWLLPGRNVLAVKVDHSRYADSRWYTGSGIYRNVYLVSAPETHFDLWGATYRTLSLTPKMAKVEVAAKVAGSAANEKIVATLTDADGQRVAQGTSRLTDGEAKLTLKVRNPQPWSVETPNLYRLHLSLERGNRVLDSCTIAAGLRTTEFSPDEGFKLNGRGMKVKGVCLHHDAGVLGAVVPDEVWERRLENLKKLGVNAIRMSHNLQAPALYDLCDRMGFLVMDENSDEWEFPKRKWLRGWNCGEPGYDGSYDFFEEWIDRDVADMVRRDRNHPSIILWSVGNEVDYPNDPYSHPVLDGATINQPMFGGYKPEAPAAERIGTIAKRLAKVIKAEDQSRAVTGAMAGVVMSNETEYPGALDVCGYNYTENRYAEDHAAYPRRVIYGSENGMGYDAWRAVADNDYIFGQFLWTGADYLGESGAWPSRGLGTGLLDFAGDPKARGMFRASLWSDSPMAYIGTYPAAWDHLSIDAPHRWNYSAGDTVRVVAYTNGTSARLLLNGVEVGETVPYDTETGILHWDIPYSPGTLAVEAFNPAGEKVAADSICTVEVPVKIHAYVERKGREVTHVVAQLLDAQGNVVTLADNMIRCTVSGPQAQLLGIESGSNSDMSTPRLNHRRAANGTVLAYVSHTADHEPITVTFTSPLLESATVTF